MVPRITEATCPACQSDVLYRYGKTRHGKERALCVMCGRQFTLGSERVEMAERPRCSVCGKAMHLYKREKILLRFRCSAYPKCKTYQKILIKEGT